jgi:hypothetical protein
MQLNVNRLTPGLEQPTCTLVSPGLWNAVGQLAEVPAGFFRKAEHVVEQHTYSQRRPRHNLRSIYRASCQGNFARESNDTYPKPEVTEKACL